MLPFATLLTVFTSSALGFFLLNTLLRLTPPSKDHVIVSKQHKWRNEVASLIHSVIVGLGALYCWNLSIRSVNDDQSYFAVIEIFGAFSTGYLVYDTMDLVWNDSVWKVLGVCVHHIASIGWVYATYMYQVERLFTLSILAMLIDISSTFLHLRMLLIMQGFDKEHPLRVTNSFVNLLLFVVCRLCIIAYILINVLLESHLIVMLRVVVPLFVFSILVINLVLFKRLIVSDYLSKNSSHSSASSSSSTCKKDIDILDT